MILLEGVSMGTRAFKAKDGTQHRSLKLAADEKIIDVPLLNGKKVEVEQYDRVCVYGELRTYNERTYFANEPIPVIFVTAATLAEIVNGLVA